MKRLEDMSLQELQALAAKEGHPVEDDGLEGMSLAELEAMAASVPGGEPELIQEMHPEIDESWVREVAKNFSQSPEATKALLKKDFPNFELKDINGQLGMRKSGEGPYYAFDPDGWRANIHPKEIWRDTKDLAYDALSGVAQGAAAAKGAVLGGLFGAGVGAFPGAVVASGAAGAGLEAGRQWLGQKFGVPQEVDGWDVGISGALGLADPFLFGAGKGAKGTLLREGGIKKAISNAAELFTGVDDPVWMRGSNAPELMRQIQAQGEDIFAEKSLAPLRKKMIGKVEHLGNRVGNEARNSGAIIDISASKKVLRDKIAELEGLNNLDDMSREYLGELKNLEKRAFSVNKEQVVQSQVPTGQVDQVTGQPIMDTVSEKKIVRQELPDQIDAENAYRVRDILAEPLNFADDPTLKVNLGKQFEGVLSNAGGSIREQFRDIPGVEQLYDDYGIAKGDLDYLRSFMQNKKNMTPATVVDDGINLMFDTKGERFLKTAGASSNSAGEKAMKKLLHFDKNYGTSTAEDARNLAASNVWKNAGWFPQSLKGTTSTSRSKFSQAGGSLIGLGIGNQLGEGNQLAGSVTGGMAGMLLTSPKAFKTYMRMANVPGMVSPEVRQSIWNAINSNEE